MYLRVTQHPHTFLKTRPVLQDLPEKEMVKVYRDWVLPIDRVAVYDMDGKPFYPLQGPSYADTFLKIVLSHPIDENPNKTWYVYGSHSELDFPSNLDKLTHLIMPISSEGAILKQSTRPHQELGEGNWYHLHAGKGLYTSNVFWHDDKHYEVKLSKPLNGKITWFVEKTQIDVWLEWQAQQIVTQSVSSMADFVA